MFSKLKIGFLPYKVYFLLLSVYILLTVTNSLPNDLLGAIGVLIVFSLILEEIGRKIPILKTFGGKVLVVTFLPSYLVYKQLIPLRSVEIINVFMDTTNFLSLFIIFIVVGSLLSMSRKVLIESTSKIFVALISAQVMGMITGCLMSLLLGLDLKYAFFFIVVPVMAGGVGEGALPLSMGYAALMGLEQGSVFAQLLPCVFMGGLIGVIYAGILNQIGLKKSHLTGYGNLVKSNKKNSNKLPVTGNKGKSNIEYTLTAVVVAITLYYASIFLHNLIDLPVPIVVLLLVIVIKVFGIIPNYLEIGSRDLYRFTVIGVSPLLLFGVGVSMTPWQDLIAVFSDFRIILVLFTIVSTIVAAGFFIGKLTGLYEIDSAIVIACCSGQGGTGALAILSAGERMELMPFAQVAVRIGGAIVVTFALNLLRMIG